MTNIAHRVQIVRAILNGVRHPAPHSRLAGVEVTRHAAPGTIGFSINRAASMIYLGFGEAGQEDCGYFFRSERMRELYDEPVSNRAALAEAARLEFEYWPSRRGLNPAGWGPYLATHVNEDLRMAVMSALGRCYCGRQED